MNRKEKDIGIPNLIFRSGLFILGLIFVLAFITSLATGISLFDPAILKLLSSIFIISLVVLGLLFVGMGAAAIFINKSPLYNGQSMLIKDNALRYEYKDGKRKYRKTFDLTNIDAYLNEYSEMYVIEGIKLTKPDKTKKANALTIMAELPDGRKMSLRDLNGENSDLYNRLAAFLDDIHEKDTVALTFRLRTFVSEENIVHSGEKTVTELKRLRKQIEDKEVLAQIDKTIDNIERTKDLIKEVGYSDKLRKLYDNYFEMLIGIVENYETLERHKVDEKELNNAKSKLIQTFDLINKAIDAILDPKDTNQFEELEAETENLDSIMKEQTETRN